MNEKISLAGDLGSGKSTVSEILINRIGAEYYSTGAIVRSIAAKRGMTVVELNLYMETHPEIDNEIDDGLKQLANIPKSLVIDSRMAWHFTEGTFKVYLTTDTEVSALRIMGANRQGEHCATLEKTVEDTRARRDSERKRYMTQYGVDIKDLTNYSVVVDTTDATPDEVAEKILYSFECWKSDKKFCAAYICPTRIMYPDDEADAELIEEYSSLLEMGENIPEITVYEENNEFYLLSGVEAAVSYALCGEVFVPCKLVKRPDSNGINYVKMMNSL